MYLGGCSVVGGSISGRPCIVPGGVVRCISQEATGGRTAEKHGGRDQFSDRELRGPVARRGCVGRFSIGASRGLESCQRIRASRAGTAPHPARGHADRVRLDQAGEPAPPSHPSGRHRTESSRRYPRQCDHLPMRSSWLCASVLVVCLLGCSSDETDPSPDSGADVSADVSPADRAPDTVACVPAGSNCAGGKACCTGLICCTGVPIPPGEDRCEQFCPMAKLSSSPAQLAPGCETR